MSGSGSAGRSVEPDRVPEIVNYYEVLFRKRDYGEDISDRYYRGEAVAAQGYVSIAVPVDTDYEVLALA